MKINIKSLTPATLTLNCLGNYIIRGREVAPNVEIAEGQLSEVRVLERAGLIRIDYLDAPSIKEIDKEIEKPKKSRGRPKGAKNKSTLDAEKQAKIEAKEQSKLDAKNKLVKRASDETDKMTRNKTNAEAITDEMESKVVVCVPGGKGVAIGKMTNSVIGEAKESIGADESIQAMEDLEAEEKEELARENGEEGENSETRDKWVVKEEDLDIADRMGEQAIISNGREAIKVDMVNSILPSADVIKERDPFIDKSEIAEDNNNDDDNDDNDNNKEADEDGDYIESLTSNPDNNEEDDFLEL